MPALSKVQFRRGTAAAWTSANPVLALGEPGHETDTGRLKVGDGVTAWTALSYYYKHDHLLGSPEGQVDHPSLTGIGPDDHHPRVHALDGPDHVLAGKTPGNYLGVGTDGASLAFIAPPASSLPTQTSHANQMLLTDGTTASWVQPKATLAALIGGASTTSTSITTTQNGEANVLDLSSGIRCPVDMRNATQVRFLVSISTLLTGGKVKPQYLVSGSTWADLASTSGDLSLSTSAAVTVDSGWKTIAAGAVSVADGTQMLRLAIFGDGSITGTFGLRSAHVQYR